MDPRDLHRKTVRLIKIMQNVKESDMGMSIKRTEIKNLKKELLSMWVNNKNMVPIANIPSKNLVMNIAQSYDQKYNTDYCSKLLFLLTSEYSVSEYSETTSVFSEYFTDTMPTELTI